MALLPVLAIGAMLIGVLFSLLTPRGDLRQRKALAVFVFGAAALVANWLLRNPNALASLEENLALSLLAIIFAFIQIIRRQ